MKERNRTMRPFGVGLDKPPDEGRRMQAVMIDLDHDFADSNNRCDTEIDETKEDFCIK